MLRNNPRNDKAHNTIEQNLPMLTRGSNMNNTQKTHIA